MGEGRAKRHTQTQRGQVATHKTPGRVPRTRQHGLCRTAARSSRRLARGCKLPLALCLLLLCSPESVSASVLFSSPPRASHLRGSRKPDIDLFWELLLFFFAKKGTPTKNCPRIPTLQAPLPWESLAQEDIPEWR